MPWLSSMSRRSESVRGLIPGQACSSCMKRRGPSERSWTINGVHFVAMISAVAATAQFSCTWTSFIVLLITRILLGAPGGRYRNGSGSSVAVRGRVQPGVHGRRALPALVDRPDDQRLAAPRVPCREDAVDRGEVAGRIDVAARVTVHAEAVEHGHLGPEEPHCKQDEVGGPRLLGAVDELERRDTGVLLPVDLLDPPVRPGESSRGDGEVA